MSQFVCDFQPYRLNDTYYRTMECVIPGVSPDPSNGFFGNVPEDWWDRTDYTGPVSHGSSGMYASAVSEDDRRGLRLGPSGRVKFWLVPEHFPGDTANDFSEVLALGRTEVPAGGVPGLGCGVDEWDRVAISGAGNDLSLSFRGGGIDLGQPGLAALMGSGAEVWMRLRRTYLSNPGPGPGGYARGRFRYQFKAWQRGQPEPATWQVDTEQNSAAPVAAKPSVIGGHGLGSYATYYYVAAGLNEAAPAPAWMDAPDYYDHWFAAAATDCAPRVMLCELYIPGWDGVDATDYTTAVLRVATSAYDSGGAWPFVGQHYPEGLVAFPAFNRALPDSVLGRRMITGGDLLIDNADGLRDTWLRAKLVGATVVLRYGHPDWPWFDFRTVFTGTVHNIAEAGPHIRLSLRDAAARYDRAIAQQTIVSATAANGQPLPLLAGSVSNVSPPLVDAALLRYALGAPDVSVSEVRDRGVPLTGSAFTVIGASAADDWLVISPAGACSVGNPVQFASAPAAPLVANTTYYVHSVPQPHLIRLSATPGGPAINLTSGAYATVDVSFPATGMLRTLAAHGLSANQPVSFIGTLPTPYTQGSTYYVRASGLNATDFSISTTAGGALLAMTVPVSTPTGTSTGVYYTYSAGHGFSENQQIVTGAQPGTTPIQAHTRYWAALHATEPATRHGFRASAGGPLVSGTVGSASGRQVYPNIRGYAVFRRLNIAATRLAWFVTGDGHLQLAANPAGQITLDASSHSANAADALRRLLGEADPVISTALDASRWPNTVGLWIDRPTNAADVLDLLAVSNGAVWYCARHGALTATAPLAGFDASPTATLTADDLIGPVQLTAVLAAVKRYEGARVGYARNHTVQRDADLAGSVTLANRDRWGSEWRVVALNAGGSGHLPGLDLGEKGPSRTLPLIETALTSQAAAQALLDSPIVNGGGRQLALYTCTALWRGLEQYREGQTVRLKIDRYGIDPDVGRNMIVVGIDEDFASHTVRLRLLAQVDGHYPITA